ncbi:hypothetical protein B0I37DRAFT_370602 [Chaetomium sp. MPI-CAGE-AT-0009]|nr:hypothetical protein B0I37DRAFT_370602 [Chaetomium sp. MPI-CAGE-AT-0009]
MRQVETAFQVIEEGPSVVGHCAALIGVVAKTSTIWRGSVRTHLKLLLPGSAGRDGMADAAFAVVTRAGGAKMLLGCRECGSPLNSGICWPVKE